MENKGESDHFLEILENLGILEEKRGVGVGLGKGRHRVFGVVGSGVPPDGRLVKVESALRSGSAHALWSALVDGILKRYPEIGDRPKRFYRTLKI